MATTGRVTLPSEENFAEETKRIAELWGADAIRNSDGTHLDDEVMALGKKLYSAYFPIRGHNEWMSVHMDETPQMYLLSDRVLAKDPAATTVEINFMESYFAEQLQANRDADPHKYWEVIDRTSGQIVPTQLWELSETSDTVVVHNVRPMHEYTLAFLANIIWDPVEMYNHLTNDWGDKEHEIPFDIYNDATREFMYKIYKTWLAENPDVDVVRFTTFFYQFTLIFDQNHREKIVDWFGYGATVSPKALDDFEAAKGYRLRPEDFVDEGFYNSTFRVPSKAQLDWLDFISGFVRTNIAQLVTLTHDAGKEAMMFLGDQWIGAEPYAPGFEKLGLDAVVGSVGDGTTLRMIADIPGVKYTEGRFLPYFFPDTFYEGNDPSIEAWDNWRKARRAILRSPIARMGYGGYLSLAAKFPKFIDSVASITSEFRELQDKTGGVGAEGELTVALLNSWGALRSWMAFTVAHALPNKQTSSYYGILEALSGMRVKVKFLSFDEVVEKGIDPDIDVIINAGPTNTAFTGADAWKNPHLVETLRTWTSQGGGFIGVGEPTSTLWQGRFFQLADVLGIDEERFQSLSIDKYFPEEASEHFITADADPDADIDFGEPILNTYPVTESVQLLRARGGQVQLSVNEYGSGRGVYISGLPYSTANARLLERALFSAAHKEDHYTAWSSSNPECEVAVYPNTGNYCVINNTDQPQQTEVSKPDGSRERFDLAPSAIVWKTL